MARQARGPETSPHRREDHGRWLSLVVDKRHYVTLGQGTTHQKAMVTVLRTIRSPTTNITRQFQAEATRSIQSVPDLSCEPIATGFGRGYARSAAKATTGSVPRGQHLRSREHIGKA